MLFKVRRLLSSKDEENFKRFESLKGQYSGKKVFIIGNGPSLNEMPLYLLKDEYTMCFNRFALMEERINWFPNFYVVTDDLVLKDQYEELNSQIVPRVDYAFFPDLHPSNISVKKLIKSKRNVLWLHVDKPEFSDRLPYCGINKTVVNAGMQIAVFLGFSEIYLLGVDMDFGNHRVKKVNSRNWQSEENDPNHFDPRYFGKGRKYHNPGVEEMLRKFEQCKVFCDKNGVRVYNAGHGGKLEVFPRVAFEDVLKMKKEEKRRLFINAAKAVNSSVEISDIQPYEREKSTETDFYVSADKGVRIIGDFIFTHVPLGPYEGRYYFMKRQLAKPV